MLYFVLAFYPPNTLVTLKSLRLELGGELPLLRGHNDPCNRGPGKEGELTVLHGEGGP